MTAIVSVSIERGIMGALADNIREAVRNERYVFTVHANQMLRKRRMVAWQVIAGLDAAKLARERPDAAPNPVVEFDQVLADGTPCKAIWAWISRVRIAKLVTVHFYDR
ncbi:MAG: hypothetical protein ABR964_12360 [Tepidisphaeraceae bacterium]